MSKNTQEPDNAEPRHIGMRIARPATDVYAYAADPANLPTWGHGLGRSITKAAEGHWIADESPLGRVEVSFTPHNDYGVIDHDVTLPSGEIVYNPVRIIPDGDACDVVFTLRRRTGMTGADFQRDAEAVLADLTTLKRLMEAR